MSSRWLRLNIDWDDSPWVFTLHAELQLAWIKLLCHVKRDGTGGKVKALAPLVAGRKWGVGEEAVTKMLQAGVNDGAIQSEDGYWIITNWAKYQEFDRTASERKRRQRAKDGHGMSRRDTVDNCHATETETETLKETSKEKFKRPTLEECREQAKTKNIPEEEGEKFWEYNEARDWMMGKSRMKNWKQGFATWARNYRERNPQKESEWVV